MRWSMPYPEEEAPKCVVFHNIIFQVGESYQAPFMAFVEFIVALLFSLLEIL